MRFSRHLTPLTLAVVVAVFCLVESPRAQTSEGARTPPAESGGSAGAAGQPILPGSGGLTQTLGEQLSGSGAQQTGDQQSEDQQSGEQQSENGQSGRPGGADGSAQNGSGALPAAAEAPDDWSYSITVAEWNRRLDEVRTYLDGETNPAGNQAAVETLEAVRDQANREKTRAQEALAAAQSRLQALGPEPGEGDPPDPSDIRRKRRQIQQEINFYKSRVSLADLALARADGLESDLSRTGREQLYKRLTSRGPLPLDPSTLVAAAGDLTALIAGIGNTARGWWTSLPYAERSVETLLARILAFVAGALLIAFLVQRFVLRRFGAHPVDEPPTYRQRLLAAIAEGLSKGLIPVAILGIIVARTQTQGHPVSGDFGDLIGVVAILIMVYIVATTLPQSVLLPDYPEWRLTRLQPQNAKRILLLTRLIALLFCVDEFLGSGIERIENLQDLRTPELNAVWTLVFNTGQALCVFALLRLSLWELTDAPAPNADTEAEAREAQGAARSATAEAEAPDPEVQAQAAEERDPGTADARQLQGRLGEEVDDETDPDDPPIEQRAGLVGAAQAARAGAGAGFWRGLRFVLGALAVVGMLAPLAGYSPLANYLLNNLLGTGLVVGVLYILRGLFRELIGLASSSHLLRERAGFDYRARTRIKFWGRAVLDVLIIAAGVLIAAPNWGVSQIEILRWVKEAFEGFTIGNVTISIGDIGFGLLAFFIVLALTGATKRMLTERVMPETEIDEGVQHSVTAGVGYAGFVIAVAMAIAVMGVDLSNIAIIAGALSVGIGFGLQNIVNNFVSGLILLIERPIRAGDWVVVGENEGFVKQISLRATEIETWHRASVVVPNADLLSSALKNWTLKDRYGRVDMAIGVALDSNPKKVERLLLQVARRHSRVVRWPEPFVVLQDVGSSRLEFELRVFTDDIMWMYVIASELRMETLRRFKEAGIVVPFDQQVLHLNRGDPRAIPRDSDGRPIPPPDHARGRAEPPRAETPRGSRDGRSEDPNEGPASNGGSADGGGAPGH